MMMFGRACLMKAMSHTTGNMTVTMIMITTTIIMVMAEGQRLVSPLPQKVRVDGGLNAL